MKTRHYSSAAVAAMLGRSASWFCRNWPRLVAEGKLPEPDRFGLGEGGGPPRWRAAEIDPIVAARSFDAAPRPSRPEPLPVGGDPELARRAREIAGAG